MKYSASAHISSGLRRIPFSAILPNLYIIGVLLLLVLTAHFASAQSMTSNFMPDNGSRARIVGGLTGAPSTGSLERRVFDLVNEERAHAGLKPLAWVDKIAGVARSHSDNMATANFFAHVDLQGRRASKRADDMGFKDWKLLGENIAWLTGSLDPAVRVVKSWMLSPGHRANIMENRYQESGIGLAIDANGKYYFTQVFVKRK